MSGNASDQPRLTVGSLLGIPLGSTASVGGGVAPSPASPTLGPNQVSPNRSLTTEEKPWTIAAGALGPVREKDPFRLDGVEARGPQAAAFGERRRIARRTDGERREVLKVRRDEPRLRCREGFLVIENAGIAGEQPQTRGVARNGSHDHVAGAAEQRRQHGQGKIHAEKAAGAAPLHAEGFGAGHERRLACP